MNSKIRIAFFSNRNSYRDGPLTYYDGANGRLIESLREKYPNFSLLTYADDVKRLTYVVPVEPKRLYTLPFLNTFSNGFKYMFTVRNNLRKLEANSDILIVQLPCKSFLAPLVLRKPTIYHICSNLQTAAQNPIKYKGIRKWIAYSYATLLHWANRQMLSKSNAFLIANGQELADLYSKYSAKAVVSSSIFATEVLSKHDLSPRGSYFRVLFVGRPSLEKGFDTLLEAIKMLADKHSTIELRCIGFDRATFAKTWKTEIPASLIERVSFAGELPFTEELFEEYRRADVLVLPSRSEGTPRVLVEARAFGCPVIASNVGGIPFSIKDGIDGLLIPSGNSEALREAIESLINNELLHYKLRLQGLHTVRESMTMDNFVDAFSTTIDNLNLHE